MTLLRCFVIDDEPFARDIMADNISRVEFLNLAGVFSNPFEAQPGIEAGLADLLFLDIRMPTLTGTQFLRSLTNPPMVVFTTAYEQYALEGYDLNVVDYLLKPIPFDRFLQAAHKAHTLFLLNHPPGLTPPESAAESMAEPSFLVVYAEYKQVRIALADILYVKGLKDYVKIFTTNQSRPILTRLNLKAMEIRLPINQFCRVHQSFIVSLAKITAFQKTNLLIGQQAIPIGKRFLADFERVYLPLV